MKHSLPTHIALAHGNGGRLMRELIDGVFAHHLGSEFLDVRADAVPLPNLEPDQRLLLTTDGFTVEPLEFPGGSLGSLAVHGTVNDLAVAGGRPLWLSLDVFIEEGFEMARLNRIVADMAAACSACGVRVVAGDTKILRRGQGGGVYLATTGLGVRPAHVDLGLHRILPGDVVLLSGSVGEHGTAVLLAREQFGLSGEVCSDAASVVPITEILLTFPGLRFMRDPTRGGLATVAYELARAVDATVCLREADIPVAEPVRAVCEILGYDPLYLASEGRVVAVLSPEDATQAQSALNARGYRDARLIGEIVPGPAEVVLKTKIGGERLLEELVSDPLPRIC